MFGPSTKPLTRSRYGTDEHGQNISLSDTFSNYHTYTIDWTPDQITWSIDGQVGRTRKRSDTYNKTTNRYEYPQTPARVQLSLWPGGLPGNGEGTIKWAGGLVDWNSQDVKDHGYFYAVVKEVSIQCYEPPSNAAKSGSKSYVYTKNGGAEDAIEITDKPTVLKSLLGSGTNMSADYPSVSSSSMATSTARSKTSSSASSSSASSSSAASEETATIPGLTGLGPGADGQRGGSIDNSNNNNNNNNNNGGGGGSSPNLSSDSNNGGSLSSSTSDNGGSPSSSTSNNGGSPSSSTSNNGGSLLSSSAVPTSTGFSQGGSSNSKGNGASGQGEQALRGSVSAGLVALAAMLLL